MPANQHIVAIFGGAVSGAEAAEQLTTRGIRTVVFDQNYLPYGKIEDGLPKWHAKLRDREEAKIDEKLSHPLVDFVPGLRLGSDLSFREVAGEWGFSAILLAVGAWRDRPLPVPGAEAFVDRGVVYQNPFIYWYNHKHEPGYRGPVYDTPDGAAIVGGGLASLDVAKVFMFENVERALAQRGIKTNLFELDRSIAKVLEKHRLTLADLGLQGCTIYYRRRPQDMPLSPMPADTPERLAKAEKVRLKILGNYQRKYLFHVQPLRTPAELIVEDDQFAGLRFQHTEVREKRVRPVPGAFTDVRTPMVVSSIGSLPEKIDGIPMNGEVFKLIAKDCCRVDGFDHVFALGNAVTGRGNIRESAEHGKAIAREMAEQYLDFESHHEFGYRSVEHHIGKRLNNIASHIHGLPPADAAAHERIRQRVRELQARIGYDGNYEGWIKKHLPVRLEEQLAEKEQRAAG